MENTHAHRLAIGVGFAGSVLGFISGHSLGARLTEGTLRTAIEAAGTQIIRSANGPVILAMSIQAATAIACAVVVPAITTLVLHRMMVLEDLHDEHTRSRLLHHADSNRHSDRGLSTTAGDADPGAGDACGSGDGIRPRLASRDHTPPE